MSDPRVDAARTAIDRAFRFGEIYWQQADSESYSQNRKAGETMEKFRAMRDAAVSDLSEALASPVAQQAEPPTLADVLDALNVFNPPREEPREPWDSTAFIAVTALPDFIHNVARAWYATPPQPVAAPVAPTEAQPVAPFNAERAADLVGKLRAVEGMHGAYDHRAADLLEELAALADSEGTRAVNYLRRARKAEAALRAAPVAVPQGLRDAVQRLVTGFEHVSGIARNWEPDYSSGSDRATWARATEACADVARMLAATPPAATTDEQAAVQYFAGNPSMALLAWTRRAAWTATTPPAAAPAEAAQPQLTAAQPADTGAGEG